MMTRPAPRMNDVIVESIDMTGVVRELCARGKFVPSQIKVADQMKLHRESSSDGAVIRHVTKG